MPDDVTRKADAEARPAVAAGPPPWTDVGRHGVFPEGRHDEIARFNFLAALNVHIATRVFPGNRQAYDKRAVPMWKAEHGGAEPKDRHEARKAISRDPYYQMWSSLRRTYMEMRQENGRSMVFKELDALVEKARAYNEGASTLELDPAMEVPRYLTQVDIHCMPGSYHTETRPDDIAAAANYDSGIFATTGGIIGKYSDGGGRAMLAWLKRNYPDFAPKRILDLGAGLGHNTVPVAKAFPEAEIVAADAAAPMLRYGHARARSMGVENIRFVQMDVEDLSRFEENSFDLILAAQFWHETSRRALPKIMEEARRVLAPGGLILSLEQPPYHNMPAYDAMIRDWDAHYNNEPFWTTLHDMNMLEEMRRAGYDGTLFETSFPAVLEEDFSSDTNQDGGKDFGRGGMWYGFGAWKGDVAPPKETWPAAA